MITLLDLAKRTGNDQLVGLIEEALGFAPELRTLPIRPIAGTSYKTLVRTAFGEGGFRGANEGTSFIKSQYAQRLVECFFFDAMMQIDEQLVSADPLLLTDEATGAVNGSFINLGRQIYSGKANDGKGFDGYKNRIAAEMIVDAEGTGEATETIYFVVEGTQGVHLPMGENAMLELGTWMRQKVTDADGKSFMAFINNLRAWIGLQVGHKYAIGAIKNVTNAKPLTDSLGAELMTKFPVGMVPTRAFMSRNSRFYLQRSRSSVGAQKSNSAGDTFAPTPTEISGVPIQVTDSILPVAANSWA